MIFYIILTLPRFSLSCAASSPTSPAITTSTVVSTTTTLEETTTTIPTTSTTSTTTTTTTTGSTCATGWTFFEGNCFYLSADTAYQPDAQEACVERGGNLASIHSTAENNFIQMLAAGNRVWIGVVRTAPGIMAWKNVDGTPFDFMNFCPGCDDNFNNYEDCITFNFTGNNGQWVTIGCVPGSNAVPMRYICERPAT